MKKSAWIALLVAGILIVCGIALIGVAAALTDGGLRQLFTEEMTWTGQGWPWNYVGEGQRNPQLDEEYQSSTWTLPAGETLTDIELYGIVRDVEISQGNTFSISYQENSRETYQFNFEDGKLQVNGEYLGQISLLWQIRDWDIRITVPASLSPSLEMSMAAGDVEIKGVTLDSLLVNSAAGDVELSSTEFQGDLDISSTAGDIELTDVRCGGPILIDSTAGDSDLTRTQAAQLLMDITAGDVELEHLQCPLVEIKSVAGDVFGTLLGNVDDYYVNLQRTVRGETYGSPDRPCSLAITTTAGDINVDFVSR